MMKISKKEIFTIPNLIGYFRILLIPIFAFVYLTAKSSTDYYIAAIIIGISGLSDMFDGKIARKFNMVTELGKLIDPVADKLTQFVIILCLATRYSYMWTLVIICIIKEGFMGVMGLIMLRRDKKLDGAMWFGKVCTAGLYLVLFILLLFPEFNPVIANGLIIFSAVMMLITLGLYVPVFYRMGKEA